MIKIGQPLKFSQIGGKENQEDFLFPISPSTSNRNFILCDGMGGHDKGEEASKIVAETLGNFLDSEEEIGIKKFEKGLKLSYDALDSIDTGSSKKPGTTMACCCINKNSYLVAHIGDSRIYHFRPSNYDKKNGIGGILYQSNDHSLVNDLLQAGEISLEEAHNFKHKNIITRAMQPNLEKRFKADAYSFDNISGGDYIFICSDGVLEAVSTEELCKIIAFPNITDVEKLELIKDACKKESKDNNSCWLIPIIETDISTKEKNPTIIKAHPEDKIKTKSHNLKSFWNWLKN